MKKEYLRWIIIVAIVLILALCGPIFVIFSGYNDPYGFPNPAWQPDRGSFLIDPKTILVSLENGETDVFTPNLGQVDGELPDVVFEGAINWKQGEYWMIADALNQFVWKDTLDDWKLYEMNFLEDCKDNSGGFNSGSMTYFKIITNDNGKKVYTVRDFFIDPKYRYVEWRGGADYTRPILGWRSIDLSNLTINAEDALRIAEENGGKDTRLRYKNNCLIRMSLVPDIQSRWHIWYSVEGLSKFDLWIDPYTGKIINK